MGIQSQKRFGVVGAGLIGTLFEKVPGFEVVHRNQWEPVRWEGLVNTAAIAGRTICEETAFSLVLGANVRMPMKMFEACQRGQDRHTGAGESEVETLSLDGGHTYQPLYSDRPVPFITFSTSAVYRKLDRVIDTVSENHPLYPQNAYSASKLLMEAMLPHDRCFIFRIPRVITNNGHPNDFCEEAKKWDVCEDVYDSVIYSDTIIRAVTRALTDPKIPFGVYNLASEVVHLPTYIKAEYGWDGEVIEPYSLGYCSTVVFDTSKAKGVGLI